eukprot:2258993-Rhodomonas_salina.10
MRELRRVNLLLAMLRSPSCLRACYAKSGTYIAYAPTREIKYPESQERFSGQLPYLPTRLLCDVRF